MDEETLREVIGVLVRVIEAAGAGIIAVGALWALARMVVEGARHRNTSVFTPIRLSLGRFLVLGLEFQLAGDILRTAVSPSFEDIGQLAAIAAIRTVLNYFLNKEIAEEQAQVGAAGTRDDEPVRRGGSATREDRPGPRDDGPGPRDDGPGPRDDGPGPRDDGSAAHDIPPPRA
ncbi:DUF1622 domain-containing protein [Saccharothrix sp. Mg75]|uniref:DUF1622 domain-containing protein n=1 Tax=Saccharothrix sp. Mg75 TaxID=3445357 RepID=UPI003EE8D628